MMKLVGGLVAALLLSAGLTAVAAESAVAACPPSRYVPCEKGVLKATYAKSVKKGTRPRAVIAVRTRGNIKARGTLVITVKGPGVEKRYTLAYAGKAKKFVGPKLRKAGTYTVSILFKSRDMGDSKKAYKVTVGKPRR